MIEPKPEKLAEWIALSIRHDAGDPSHRSRLLELQKELGFDIPAMWDARRHRNLLLVSSLDGLGMDLTHEGYRRGMCAIGCKAQVDPIGEAGWPDHRVRRDIQNAWRATHRAAHDIEQLDDPGGLAPLPCAVHRIEYWAGKIHVQWEREADAASARALARLFDQMLVALRRRRELCLSTGTYVKRPVLKTVHWHRDKPLFPEKNSPKRYPPKQKPPAQADPLRTAVNL